MHASAFTRSLTFGVFGLLASGLVACSSAAPATPTSAPAPTAAAAKPAASPAAVASPSAAVSASPSTAASVSPSPSPQLSASPAASAVASPSAAAAAAAAPRPNATVHFTASTAGQSLPAGTVSVSIDYSGPALVAAANATKLDDYHLHYFLDESAAAYLGTLVPVPTGNAKIVHSAATQVTFDAVPAGPHTLTVMLSGANHISVNPPITDQVTFTVN